MRRAHREIESLNVAGAYPVFIAVAEHRQLFYIGYLGWGVAGGFLSALIVLYQHGEINLRLKSERHVLPIRCKAISGQVESASPDSSLHLHQERPAPVTVALADLVSQDQLVVPNGREPALDQYLARIKQPFSKWVKEQIGRGEVAAHPSVDRAGNRLN